MTRRLRLASAATLLVAAVGTVAGLTAATTSADARTVTADAAAPATRMIVNLTVDDRSVHRVDQALTLAKAARGQGQEVVLFLNVDAPRLADASTPVTAGLPGKPALGAQLRSLIDGGVTVIVAKGCAGVCSVDLENLVPGARAGTAGEIAGLAADGGVVVSY